jgi:hypothetical protein
MTTLHAKDVSSYYTDAIVARARSLSESTEWGQARRQSLLAGCAWYLNMSLEELWEFVPPAEQLRAINVSHGVGCPDCGDAIFKKGGHYPWVLDRDLPFKVTCPICGRQFPEADFVPWNPQGKDTPPEKGNPVADRGVGWEDADGHRYYFVAYYLFWQRWRKDIVRGAHLLGQAYLLTGNPDYARRAGVLLARVAAQYKSFHYETQVYHEGIWNIRGRISDYIWSTGDDSNLTLAYDAVCPVLAGDGDMKAFLASRGVGTPCKLIEQEMLQTMADDIMRGYVAGNMGMHQKTLCELAIVLDNDDRALGKTTEEMRSWLLHGEGRIEHLLWNGFWRDGLGGESSPSYASGWGMRFYDLADLLPRIGAHIWENPRLRKMADIGLDLTVAGEFTPCIGDCGGVRGARRVGWSAEVFGSALSQYGDPRYGAAIRLLGARNQDLWHEVFDEAAVARVPEEAAAVRPVTRNLGGYGLAVLESGSSENRRAVTLYYGDASTGHGHRDRLTIGFFALGYPMFSEMGYPTPFRTPRRFGWSSNSLSHYTVMVDETPHQSLHRGKLHLLASVPDHVQVVTASAEHVYPDTVSLYRRTTALVDVPESDRGYVVDIFRVRGGGRHDWSFHGPAFTEFAVSGGTPGPELPGTLAGPDVPFGGKPDERKYGQVTSGYEWLRHVRGFAPDGMWSATWRNPADGVALTTTVPANSFDEVFLAAGQPELQKGNPDDIFYTIGRRTFDGDRAPVSVCASVSEAHRGAPDVLRVERLGNQTDEAVALVVTRRDGIDLIHSGNENEEVCWRVGDRDVVVAAEFAVVSFGHSGVRCGSMVNGRTLRCGETQMNGTGSAKGVVESVDLRENTATVRFESDAEALEGTTVIVGNDGKQVGFTVESAAAVNDAVAIGFGTVLMRVGMGDVTSVDPETGEVVASRELTGYGRIDGGRHEGRWLFADDLKTGFRIREVRKLSFVLEGEPADIAAAFRDADGDGRNLYWISSIGPGDWVHAPATVTVGRDTPPQPEE